MALKTKVSYLNKGLGWYAEFLLKIILQQNSSKIYLQDHAEISAYWPWPLTGGGFMHYILSSIARSGTFKKCEFISIENVYLW